MHSEKRKKGKVNINLKDIHIINMKIKKINSFEIKTQVILSDTAEMDSIMLWTCYLALLSGHSCPYSLRG